MTRYLLPDREEALIIERPALAGYVWVTHPKLGVIQMPDTPDNLTPPEPPDGTVLMSSDGDVIARRDHWAEAHSPHERWFSLADKERYFWPDICNAWKPSDMTQLVRAQDEEEGK